MTVSNKLAAAIAALRPGEPFNLVGNSLDGLEFADPSKRPTDAEILAEKDRQTALEMVPASVTRLQARLALKQAGLLASVTAAILALPETDDVRLFWDNGATWERQSPVLCAMAEGLGLTDQIDALFVLAASLG